MGTIAYLAEDNLSIEITYFKNYFATSILNSAMDIVFVLKLYVQL